MLPTHCYKPGFLYIQESDARASIAKSGINTDRSIFFKWTDTGDHRSERPKVIKATMAIKDNNEQSTMQVMKDVPIMKETMVEIGPQLRTKDMVVIEDRSAEALPGSTNETTHAAQADKHNQLSVEAGKRILDSFLTNLSGGNVGGRKPSFIIDLSLRTGDILKAVLTYSHCNLGQTIHYIGLGESDDAIEFAKGEAIAYLKQKYLEGEFKLPSGMELPPEDPPPDLGDTTNAFEKPKLNELKWAGYPPINYHKRFQSNMNT